MTQLLPITELVFILYFDLFFLFFWLAELHIFLGRSVFVDLLRVFCSSENISQMMALILELFILKDEK